MSRKNLAESIADTAVMNKRIEDKLGQFEPAVQTRILDALEAVKNAGPNGISPADWARAVKSLHPEDDFDVVNLLKDAIRNFGFVVKRIGDKLYGWSEKDDGLGDVDPQMANAMRMQIQLGQLATATMRELGEFDREELATAIAGKTGMPQEAALEYAEHVMGQFIGGMLQQVSPGRYRVEIEEPKTADDHIRDLLRRSGLSENVLKYGVKMAPEILKRLMGKQAKGASNAPPKGASGIYPPGSWGADYPIKADRAIPKGDTGLSIGRDAGRLGASTGVSLSKTDRWIPTIGKMPPSLKNRLMMAAYRATVDTAAASVVAHDAYEIYNEIRKGDLRDPKFRQEITTKVAQMIQQDGSMLLGLYLGGLLGRGMTVAKGGIGEIPGNVLGLLAAGATDIWYGSTADEIVANAVADMYGKKEGIEEETDDAEDHFKSMVEFVKDLSEDDEDDEDGIVTINSDPRMHPNQDDLRKGKV